MANIGSKFSNIFSCKSKARLLKERVRILKDRHEIITFDFLLKRSKEGFAYYQTDLANCYLFGYFNTPIDIAEGLKWLNKAVNGNDRMAIHNMATFLREGKIIKQDYKKAIRLYKKSAKLGLSRSWNDLGRLYEDKNENKKAEKCYLESIKTDRNNFMALENLGILRLYKLSGKEKEALNNFLELINKGSIRENFIESGKVLIELKDKLGKVDEEIDRNKLNEIYKKAKSLAALFHILYELQGTSKKEDFNLFLKVCQTYEVPSVYYKLVVNDENVYKVYDLIYLKVAKAINLPLLYEIKHSISTWTVSDICETGRGAELEEPSEVCNLGCLYYFGIEGKNNDKTSNYQHAFNLFKKSASLGYDVAKYWMAVCLEEGKGVVKNEAKAIELYRQILADSRIDSRIKHPFGVSFNNDLVEPNNLILDSAYRLGNLLYLMPELQNEGIGILFELMINYSHHFAALELCKIAITKGYSIPNTNFNRDMVIKNLETLGLNGVGEAYTLLALENEKDGEIQKAINNYILAFMYGQLDVVSDLKRLNFHF